MTLAKRSHRSLLNKGDFSTVLWLRRKFVTSTYDPGLQELGWCRLAAAMIAV